MYGQEERLRLYEKFTLNKLLFTSEGFAKQVQPNAIMPITEDRLLGLATTITKLEVREIDQTISIGTVQTVEYSSGGNVYGERFKWFYLDRVGIETIQEAKMHCENFISGYEDAVYENQKDSQEQSIGRIL